MRKIIVFASLVLLLMSCKKNSDDNGAIAANSIQANIGGTTYNFNVSAKAIKMDGTGYHFISIAGADANSATANVIGIIANSNVAVTTGTYNENDAVNFGSLSYSVNISSGNTYTDAGSTTNPVIVTITSLTGTSVQGTFKGDIYLGSSTSGTKKVVADGKFNVPF